VKCEMIRPAVKVLIVYVAVRDNPLLVSHAGHFVDSYRCHPPGYEHRLVVVCNGGMLSEKNAAIFAPIDHEMNRRENDAGWDVSAYMDTATDFPGYDLQVCLGESVYFNREGWLKRTVECYQQYGPGMYGYFSSFLVRPHLNTTAFAVSPRYLREYQPRPRDQKGRYDFEHGPDAMWRRVAAHGGQARLVTWDGCWEPRDWRKPKDILWRGDQSNCLMACNHTEKFNAASPVTKQRWSLNADTLTNKPTFMLQVTK
jgi:hypothetical protein